MFDEIKKSQQNLIYRQEVLKVKVRGLADQVAADALNVFKADFHFNVLDCILSGFNSPQWEPKIFLFPRDPLVVKIKGVGWRRLRPEGQGTLEVYPHHIQDSQVGINLEDLEAKISEFQAKWGIPVQFLEKEMAQIPSDHCYSNANEILLVHPDASVLAQGEALYPGWECNDPWVLIQKKEGEKMLFYGTKGSGYMTKTIREVDVGNRIYESYLEDMDESATITNLVVLEEKSKG